MCAADMGARLILSSAIAEPHEAGPKLCATRPGGTGERPGLLAALDLCQRSQRLAGAVAFPCRRR